MSAPLLASAPPIYQSEPVRTTFIAPSAIGNEPQYTKIIGPDVFVKPNVRPEKSKEDLSQIINGDDTLSDGCWGSCCCLIPILGWCYLCCSMKLIKEGEYGFSKLNGKPRIYHAGRHFIAHPFNNWEGTHQIGEDTITQQPITIIRVPEGCLGFANNNSLPEILLPGLHARISTAFKFFANEATDQELLAYGPIKIFLVKSGTVRVCYDKGKVVIFQEGRYCVNSAAFKVTEVINTQQQNMRFSKHPVLLDGGIGLLVEGLLTFKVIDVEKLIKELGDRDLARAIEDVTKAEISRVFAGIHLEQISSAVVNPSQSQNTTKVLVIDSTPGIIKLDPTKPESVLGNDLKESGDREGEERSKLCGAIILSISPICAQWGVRIINFQLESTKIADQKYAMEYEQASLGMAKAKANLRSVDAETEIQVRRATASARSVQIRANGLRESAVIAAQGEAEVRRIDSEARNNAASAMTDEFAMRFALAGQQVEFAESLQAESLTVIGDSGAGRAIIPMFTMIQQQNQQQRLR